MRLRSWAFQRGRAGSLEGAELVKERLEPMKQLTQTETPHELAELNVIIRERSLATA